MKQLIITLLIFILACNGADHQDADMHGHHDSNATEVAVGPHGGKLFEEDDFGVEVTIYEPDIPPQSRIYFYENDKALDPSLVDFTMELHRIDRVDVFKYEKQDDYLLGDQIVEEPHSFDVKFKAKYQGKEYQWEYESHEGRAELSPKAIKSSGIKIDTAKSSNIKSILSLNGQITPNHNQHVEIAARFAGVIKSKNKNFGEKIEKGEVLAEVESNQSLKVYEIRSPISGTITKCNIAAGDFVAEGQEVFGITDLSTVWVDLDVYPKDIKKVKAGQKLLIKPNSESEKQYRSVISYVSAVAEQDTQKFIARAELQNDKGDLNPGIFITGDIVVSEELVPVVVKSSALQTYRDWDVVFKKVGNLFEIAIVEIGRRDGDLVEILSGIKAGDKYAAENSFIIKADVLKSGASHDH